MRFFAHSLALTLLFLGGCAAQPASVVTSEPVATVEGARGEGADDNSMATLAPVSPYQRERRRVPADASRRFSAANELIAAQQWELAVPALLALAAEYPHLSGPRLNLALVYRQLGDPQQAQLWFGQSINSNANNISAYNEYGIFLREQGRFEEAAGIYLQALDVWEASAATHRNLGILFDLYLGYPDQAVQHYQRYQELTAHEDRGVKGWIADLQRQYPFLAMGGAR